MERKEYNGWTNYETWCVNLWLTNDEGSYEMARDAARQDETGEALREMVEEWNPVTDASMFSDLMNAALSEVDWQEIRDSLIEDDEQEEEEKDND